MQNANKGLAKLAGEAVKLAASSFPQKKRNQPATHRTGYAASHAKGWKYARSNDEGLTDRLFSFAWRGVRSISAHVRDGQIPTETLTGGLNPLTGACIYGQCINARHENSPCYKTPSGDSKAELDPNASSYTPPTPKKKSMKRAPRLRRETRSSVRKRDVFWSWAEFWLGVRCQWLD